MSKKKYAAFAVMLLLFAITSARAETVAEYEIKFKGYDTDTKAYTADVYLNTTEYLSTGTFGMSYDASLSPVFTLDEDNFEYFQQFDSDGEPYIAFQWYLKDVNPTTGETNPTTGELHLGTITIPDVVLNNGKPLGWHTHTLRQLDWLTTATSQLPKYTLNEDGVCLNDEIWRAITGDDTTDTTDDPSDETPDDTVDDPPDETTTDPATDTTITGYYQGYDMQDEDNPKWVDIGFTWNSGYDLPERSGQVISGMVQSYNPNNKTTVTLYNPDGTYQSTETTDGDPYADGRVIGAYELAVDTDGEYTLEIKKDAHLTYKTAVTVEGSTVSLEKIKLYCGDVTGDEKIKLDDRTILRRYLNRCLDASNAKCDLNGDGKVTFHDLDILKTYYNRSYEGAM